MEVVHDWRRPSDRLIRVFTPVIVTAALVVLAWSTIRGTGTSFPPTLLQAEAAVLAALVFVLGLNQSSTQRGFDAVVREARAWEDRAAAAATGSAVPATRVWTWAGRDTWILRFTRGPELFREMRSMTGELEEFADDTWSLRRLGLTERVCHLEGRLSTETLSDRTRRRLERRTQILRNRISMNYERAQRLGVLTAGLRRLVGRALVVMARAEHLNRLLTWFTWLLVAALLVGVVRSGPASATWADPGLWVAVALPVIAATYRAVVTSQLHHEAASMVTGLRSSWLVQLYDAESHLGRLSVELERGSADGRVPTTERDDVQPLLLCLDLAETSAPEVPWLASLRGRLHLARAIPVRQRLDEPDGRPPGRRSRDSAALASELANAEHHLRHAVTCASDPIARLALARCLTCSVGEPEPAARAEATELVGEALGLLERMRPERWDFGFGKATGVRLAHEWIAAQTVLLRPDLPDLAARFDLALDQHARPEDVST